MRHAHLTRTQIVRTAMPRTFTPTREGLFLRMDKRQAHNLRQFSNKQSTIYSCQSASD